MATIPTQNAVPSEAPRDLKFNSGKIDEFVTSLEHEYKDRFGRCHMTIEGMRWIFENLMERFKIDINQAIIAAGYIPMDSFQLGAEITKRNEILRDETTGEYYRWDGDLPKSVLAGSTPESAGGVGMGAWVSVGDASLRGELSQTEGYKLIGGLCKLINPHDLTIENINKTPLDSAIELKNKAKNVLRFATNNLWTEYSTNTWFGGDRVSPEKTMQLKKLWLKVSADVWGFQEVFTSPTKDISMFLIPPYDSAFFTTARPTTKGFQYGTACMTRLPVLKHEKGKFDSEPTPLDHEYRVYDLLFLENGVLFVNTHLSTDPARTTKMLSDLAIKVSELGIEKVVIVGDMNTRNLNDFKPLEDIGFTLVNKDSWSDIDRVLIRGVNLVGSGMVKILGGSPWSQLSDHDLYFVDVEV